MEVFERKGAGIQIIGTSGFGQYLDALESERTERERRKAEEERYRKQYERREEKRLLREARAAKEADPEVLGLYVRDELLASGLISPDCEVEMVDGRPVISPPSDDGE